MAITTLSELFFKAASYNKPDCLLHKSGDAYQAISTAELVDRVRRLAKALGELGVVRGDRVALMSENGPHWAAIDFATLTSGAVLVPIYPTLLPEQAAYIAKDCGAKVVFAETTHHLEGLLAHAAELGEVQHFVLIKGDSDDARVTTLATLYESGEGADPAAFEQEARKAQPDDLATFVYTSGTTGQPKGVMLTHRNIASNVSDAMRFVDLNSSQTALSILPLSHSFERTVDYCYFYRGTTIAYAESVQALAKNLQEVRPHVFVAVPRLYEKLVARFQEKAAADSPLKQRFFQFAVDTGRQALPWRLKGEAPGGLLGLKLKIADSLVFSKIKAALGGRIQFALSGGAPLARDIAEFFWGAGIPIYEGYGLSETAPVLTVNNPAGTKPGTVGRAIDNVELKIASDGEILARGPNIMKGYWNMPKETAEVLDSDGFFHTGDIGEIDGDGFLRITDRKKELLVNAYGKNVAPAPIENALKSSRYISQAVVLGDRRKFISALLVPEFEALKSWAGKNGLAPGVTGDKTALLKDPKVRELYAHEVEQVNGNLASFEQIVAWDLLPNEFTLETGELTPTQKVKRRVINEKYADVIDRIYKNAEGKG